MLYSKKHYWASRQHKCLLRRRGPTKLWFQRVIAPRCTLMIFKKTPLDAPKVGVWKPKVRSKGSTYEYRANRIS